MNFKNAVPTFPFCCIYRKFNQLWLWINESTIEVQQVLDHCNGRPPDPKEVYPQIVAVKSALSLFLILSRNSPVLNIFLLYKITVRARNFNTLCSTQKFCIFSLLSNSFVDRYIFSYTFNGNSAGKYDGIYLVCSWLVPSVLFYYL